MPSAALKPRSRPANSFVGLVLSCLAVGLPALGAARGLFLWSHLPAAGADGASLAAAFATGARFDLKLLALVSLTVLAAAAAWARWGPPRWQRPVLRTAVLLALGVPLFAQLCQHQYYHYFRTAFTPIVFGFVEDDTVAVLDLIWKDYPVLPLFALWSVSLAALTWAALRLHDALSVRLAALPSRARGVVLLALLIALAGLARGSLGTFPLRRTDADISADPVVNDSVRSGLIALHDAWRDRRDQVPRIGRADERLPFYGFDTAVGAARALGLAVTHDDAIEDALFVRTPRNPAAEQRPPHVVLGLMESWSAALAGFHDPQHNDLLGRFAPHRERDLWFTHFYPVHGGTHPTLEGLLLNSPLTPLTQGLYGQHVFATSAARPFKEAGYRTVFVYGGAGNWRSVGSVFGRQYFDESYSQSHIQKRYPEARGNLWGVYDEYLMRFVGDLLDEADHKGQKLFVFFLSTTHHPPHEVPPGTVTKPVDLARVKGRLVPAPELTRNVLETFQYANDQFGGLLDRIEASPYAAHTIVAATGDHNMKSIFTYPQPAQMSDLHAVPLYLRAPPAYRQGAVPDPDRYGAHADLLPTLYDLALSDARHLGNGRSMLRPVPPEANYGVTMYDTLFAPEGAARPVVGETRYFRWDAAGLDLRPDAAPPESLRRKVQRARAMIALQDWAIRRDVLRTESDTSAP